MGSKYHLKSLSNKKFEQLAIHVNPFTYALIEIIYFQYILCIYSIYPIALVKCFIAKPSKIQ